jgi:serine/threonine-protein kinase
VVHRDLKSDNIMLLDTMTGDHAKVLDFGIAKINEPDGAVDTNLTAPNLVIGTPQYMSPEQCSQDGEIDARSDIYSFGVILYEMLVGHVPFSGDSPTIEMMKHLQDPVPSVLEERSDLPASVARVVARAMAKVPGNRYQNVAELVEDLTIASGMTIHRLGPVDTTAAGSPKIHDEPDEVTVVRAREEPAYVPPSVPRREPVMVPVSGAMPPPQAASSFNPMKILIPAAVALLVVFGLFFVFNRNTPTTDANTNQAPTLAADPNSQPVQPAQPATGKSEEGLPSGGTINPAANVNASPNTNAAVSPEPDEDVSPSANTNANANENSNANSNSNRKVAPPLPEPTRSVETPPPPALSPTPKPPAEKPSPTATP